jgi:hypothetical protein
VLVRVVRGKFFSSSQSQCQQNGNKSADARQNSSLFLCVSAPLREIFLFIRVICPISVIRGKISSLQNQRQHNKKAMQSPKNLALSKNTLKRRQKGLSIGVFYASMGFFNSTKPLFNSTKPSRNPSKPLFNSTKPLFNSTKPFWNPSKPLFNSTKGFFNSTKALFNSTKPSRNPSKPLFNSTKALFNSTKPLFNSTKPLFNSTKPSRNHYNA